MALDPAILQGAYVATSDPAGAIGGIPAQLNVPVFVKVFFEAGRSYNVSTNVVPGDLVLLGPNGGPIAPSGAIKSITHTPLTSGVYVIEFVANPRFVASGQPINVVVTEQNLGLPTDITSALGLDLAAAVNGGLGLEIAAGGRQQQYFLHAPGTVLATDASDILLGTEGANLLTAHGGNDRIFAGGGNDVLVGGPGNDHLDGGNGVDTAVFAGSPSQYQAGKAGSRLFLAGPDGLDELVNVEQLVIGDSAPIAVSAVLSQASTVTMAFQVTNPSTRQATAVEATPYSGSVNYLSLQYLGRPAGEAVNGTAFNDFINTLGGDDAVNAGAGDDVVDGGSGSNFLAGGAGADVFFLDGRGGGTTWSTITDWEGGEQLSLWGWRPGVSRARWVDSDGAADFRGATIHADLNGDGTIDASVTWARIARANLPAPRELDGLLWFA